MGLTITTRRQPTCSFQTTHSSMRNVAILTGYRPLYQPWCYYMLSLFGIHNETVNVWTHLIGCCVVIYQMYSYSFVYSRAGSDVIWTLYAFGICCLVTLMSSAIAHLIHSKSAFVNYVVFMFDYIGVVFWLFGTGLLALYGVSEAESYRRVEGGFVFLHMCLCYLNFLNISYGKLRYGKDMSNYRRTLMLIGGIAATEVFVVVPFAVRYITCIFDSECSLASLNHLTHVMLLFGAIALVFVGHQPEKAFPGWFDFIGQSHHIFHVLVVLTQWMQFSALYEDFLHERNKHCSPNIWWLLGYMVTLYSACVLTIFHFRHQIRQIVKKDKADQVTLIN